jgi:hypothetical protein
MRLSETSKCFVYKKALLADQGTHGQMEHALYEHFMSVDLHGSRKRSFVRG